ncbi:alpha/beta fold hydrolase [Gleimia sp. 6138-11-ORH1]|uniref:alpha/beta fold hydrolase n=1 Tax=Gleimia sp. 6138-11-ORH1 TaxID=2973937 RepID=UPI00216A65BF|nr:alpha/beta fold hydrolase [Gleimia sp. 6138-11-ORH1]MCS4484314.1 alpha/beta fold hydrolase [Gleimia sp. 6138-11-ORH1]
MNRLNLNVFGKASEEVVPLVLIHALGTDSSSFKQVIAALNYPWTITVDLPGHGKSAPLSTLKPSSPEVVFTAILENLEAIGVQQFHLAGISIGGMLSWYGLTHYPAQVLSATVLCAGPANLPATQWEERARKVRASGVAHLVEPTMERWFTPEMFRNRPREIEWIKETYRNCNPEGYAQCCEVLANLDLREKELPAGRNFTLAAAEHDGGFPPETGQSVFQSICDRHQSPQVESGVATASGKLHFQVIKGAAHQAAVEQPQQVAEIIKLALGN